MKKKINAIIGFIVTIVVCLFLGSCASDNVEPSYKDSATIIYHLEGATYKNSTEDVKVYYPVKKDSSIIVKRSLDELTEQYSINSPGSDLIFAGWFKAKSESGEYSDEFNFGTDKISYNETVNLYAKWTKKYIHTLNYVARIDGEDVVLVSRNISANAAYTLDEDREESIKETLYSKDLTYIKTFEVDGKVCSKKDLEEIKMPEEKDINENLTKNVYVNYIEGKYYLVSNKSSFNSAIASKDEYDGMYLLNDLELGSNTLLGINTDYEILGNGYKIVIDYAATTVTIIEKEKLEITSLFGNANNLKISDLTIEVSFKKRIVDATKDSSYFAPIGYNITNCEFNNVTINYSIKENINKLQYCDNENGVYSYENTTFNNVNINKK